MSPEDPRHGTYAGAVAHWFAGQRPCDDCARAEWRYRKKRKLRHLRGDSPTVPAIGYLRRVQALQALGWTGPQIAEHAGLSLATMRSIHYHGSATIHTATAAKIAEVYDRLSMKRPEGQYADRARSMAQRRGWLPPLAWDDIDDPDERPSTRHVRRTVDEVAVQRVLAGDFTCARALSPAERAKVLARWTATGRSAAELGRLTGWKPERYKDVSA